MSVKRMTLLQGLVLVGLFALMVVAILIASQLYLSYIEVTEAADNCFNIGGYPVIEKTGLEMTYFECVTN
ncbi:hypothetical protein [Oceanobacillus bengalensis]|uniref:Uncharacterized protein n=1 Tax=Oceanobacillus bengalensis TaxID=1435466 RepID=A0A494YS59_9BACI|nr:hypothetical protein [Oceanobacillus bengalensis]RKQ12498.1 hypothetical protein D8M05_18015 [Oceanobacillus bengalensis]